MGLDTILARMSLAANCFQAVVAVVKEFVNPDTPDDRQKCLDTLTQVLTAYTPDAPIYAGYITDVIEALAGGKGAVDHVMADMSHAFSSRGVALDANLEGAARDLLTRLEGAIQDYRAGKPMGS